MLKNRSIQLKFVKDPKKDEPVAPPETAFDLDHAAVVATVLGKKAVKGAVIVIAAYFAADTLRLVIVDAVTKR